VRRRSGRLPVHANKVVERFQAILRRCSAFFIFHNQLAKKRFRIVETNHPAGGHSVVAMRQRSADRRAGDREKALGDTVDA